MSQENVQLVRLALEAINRGDIDDVDVIAVNHVLLRGRTSEVSVDAVGARPRAPRSIRGRIVEPIWTLRGGRDTLRRVRRGIAATILATALTIALSAPAQATYHLIKVREVATNPAGADSAYIELQMYSAGQNLVGGHAVTFYTATGTLLATFALTSDVANGDNQRTVLIGDTAAAGSPDFVYDQLSDAIQTYGPGGAACWDTVDCVSWGGFTGAAMLPSPPGNAAPAIPDGSALVRSITPNCETLLEAADDTDNSVADFALGTPSPRNNATTPTEKACDGGGGGGGAPETTITKKPKKKTTKTKAKLKFKSSEAGSSFECKLDKSKFRSCSSPRKYKHLKPGKHRFQVRAIDADGNVDPTPAKAKWRVLD